MLDFRLINRDGVHYLRHWQGHEQGDWIEELISSESGIVRKARIATKVAVELAMAWGWKFDHYDTLHQVRVGNQSWIVVVTSGTGFSSQDGEEWYPIGEALIEGLQAVKLGRVVWEPCQLPL